MNYAKVAALSLAVLVLLGWLLAGLDAEPGGESSEGGELLLYCAAGVKPPVEELARQFEKEVGVRVRIQYGGSGTLLSNIKVARQGDLYLAADDSYLELASDAGLVQEVLSLARMTPVIAVANGNPKGIASVEDLLREDVKVALANPDAASVGKLTRKLLEDAGLWEQMKAHVSRKGVFKPTVNELANDVKLGAVDATIIWDAVARQYASVEAIASPILSVATKNISVGVLNSSSEPTIALRFARYLAASDRGQPVFAAHGYDTLSGDSWALVPEVRLLSGSMLRPAVEEAIQGFEKREGVRVTRVYNGCGILVSQMRAGEKPDAYFSCDVTFMDQVADLFLPSKDITSNPMVLLVEKGNPKDIQKIEDLPRPGLKIGLGHPDKSALGALTQNLLRERGLEGPLRKSGNLKVESATGDFLVNQMRTGSLDAAIVYISNAAYVRDHLDMVPITGEGAVAVQPVAVGKSTRHRHLMERLMAAIQTPESKTRFEELGFTWKDAHDTSDEVGNRAN